MKRQNTILYIKHNQELNFVPKSTKYRTLSHLPKRNPPQEEEKEREEVESEKITRQINKFALRLTEYQ